VERIFSPEFRNRLDKVVIFNALGTDVIEDIVQKEIKGFNSQLAEKKVEVEVAPAALRWLAERGYSEEFGARNISRLVEEKVKSYFVDAVLFGELEHGGTAVVDVEDDDITIRAEGAPQPEQVEAERRPALEAPSDVGEQAGAPERESAVDDE
jgi:ATP-dependent Clp protease ATP-binding subunit ClpA